MKNTNKLIALANKLEGKFAQQMSAQSADIEDALKAAGLWNLSDAVAPLLNLANVPGNCAVDIDILVNPNGAVKYAVTLTPAHQSAAKLSNLIGKNYGVKMATAIKKANLKVAAPMRLNWLNY